MSSLTASFVARQLTNSNPSLHAIADIQLALESAPAKAADSEAAVIRVHMGEEPKVFLVRGPGASEKVGKVTLNTENGILEGYTLAAAKPVLSRFQSVQTMSLYVGAAGAMGGSIAIFAPLFVPLLEHVAGQAGLPPQVGSGFFWVLDAVLSGMVAKPLFTGKTADAKVNRLANATIDAYLADGAPTLTVHQINR